ncbi:DUF1194 domain-containing protein [Roseovarius sp. D22-M7]|uniref:DUF1194 domain-containing protein n=1 Tax=Roseovarius sp. D22-M7 TaxID=3127116 RepID=UPI0030100BD8
MGEHGKHRLLVRLAALLSGLGAAPAEAACRLALALAVDASSSVDALDYNLQREGLAAALDAPDIRRAILMSGRGDVVLSVYEWSGRFQQQLHLDWTPLRSPDDITRAVATIAGMRRVTAEFPTALGSALGYGAQLMTRAPADCARRVIDVSGDGANNQGFGPRLAYRHFPFDGITVNGLVVLGHGPTVVAHYSDEVLRGPGAFLELARGYADFERAMGRKLFREISDLVVGARPDQ